MKVKLKMDPAQAKALLLAHVEKVVFGAVIVCFLMLCWTSLKVAPYPTKPGDLEQQATKIKLDVDKSQPPTPLPGVAKIDDFSMRVRASMGDIDYRAYPIAPLNRPAVELKVRRKEPAFLAARDLKAYSGVGILAIGEGTQDRGRRDGGGMAGGDMPGGMQGGPGGMQGGPGGMQGGRGGRKGNRGRAKPAEKKIAAPAPETSNDDEELEQFALKPQGNATYQGRHWICVTALVPFAAQSGEYRKVFQNATFKNAELDEPRYDRFEVQRALVKTPGQPIGEDDWEKLDMEAAYDDMETWLPYPEVVDPLYIDDALTWFLPPLVGANHDPNRVRHPAIPLKGQPAATVVGPAEADKPLGKKKVNRRAAAARGNRGAGALGGSGRGNMDGGNMDGGNMVGGNMGMGNRGMGGMARSGFRQKLVENKLFRFFDTTVEAGKSYRYRVRLELNNPNLDVLSMYLDTSRRDLSKGETRQTAWSEPSGEIYVPRAGSLLAGDVTPAAGAKETQAQVMVQTFDPEKGIAAAKTFDLKRGSLANAAGVEVQVADYGAAGGAKTETVDFETNAVCLDMVGGEKLPAGAGKAPGRVLMVDANGELAVLDQFTDVVSFDREQRQQQRLKNNTGAGPMNGRSRDSGGDGKSGILNLGVPGDDEPKKGKRSRRR